MTRTPASGDESARALRTDAARWFAAMRGPRAEQSRAAFEAWLAQSEQHRKAYAWAADVFAVGKALQGRDPATVALPVGRRFGVVIAGAAGLLALGVAVLVGVEWRSTSSAPTIASAKAGTAAPLSTRPDGQAAFGLPDGSTVLLDVSSQVGVRYSDQQRTLNLTRGRARFDVAHETRPFTVSTSAGLIVARGTVFDVTIISGGRVNVRMMRGAVDVQGPNSVLRLVAGQSFTFVRERKPYAVPATVQVGGGWVADRMNCDRVPLSAVLSEASRHSGRRIALGSEEMGAVRVSGTFRIDDPERLALDLAVVLGMQVTSRDDGSLMLIRKVAQT